MSFTTLPPAAIESEQATISIPGVLVCVGGIGVLLRGQSASGKSELALMLIERGHAFVADDIVMCSVKDNQIVGCAPPMLIHLLEIRDLGVLNIQQLFGKQSITSQAKISIIIELSDNSNLDYTDRLHPSMSDFELLGQTLPVYHLHHCHTRPLPILVETLVKNWIITQSGSCGAGQLTARHAQTLEANSL